MIHRNLDHSLSVLNCQLVYFTFFSSNLKIATILYTWNYYKITLNINCNWKIILNWKSKLKKNVHNWAPSFVSQICFALPIVLPSNYRSTAFFSKSRPKTLELFITLPFLLYKILFINSRINYTVKIYTLWDHMHFSSSFTWLITIAF